MKLVLPCFSDVYDREHDAVLLDVPLALKATLIAVRRVFDLSKADYPELERHEYRASGLLLVQDEDGRDVLDILDGPEPFEEPDFPVTFTDIPHPYLVVVPEGFYYIWNERKDEYGPSETYETHVFALDDIKGL